MDDQQLLAERFEAQRGHLRAVAYRMLGSLSDADDAVQEAWLRLSRTDPSGIEKLGGWLTTVVARICLDLLRSRTARREEFLDEHGAELAGSQAHAVDPEEEAVLADAVGLALLVVLDRLAPAERLAFVLHDLFGVTFEEIGLIVDRSPVAARQLASRARRRVRGPATLPTADLRRQRAVVNAFLAASRGGNFEALLAVLDPEVEFHADRVAVAAGATEELSGAVAVATRYLGGAQLARPALVNGTVGIVVAPRGELGVALILTFAHDKIARIEAIRDPVQLAKLDLTVLDA